MRGTLETIIIIIIIREYKRKSKKNPFLYSSLKNSFKILIF